MINQSPILITGCPRSGTTIVARAVHVAGAFMGESSKRGMLENDEIKTKVVKPFFNLIGQDCRGQFVKLETPNPIQNDWQTRIERILTTQKYTPNDVWMYKGLSCLIWPVWKLNFPEAKWIIVRRRTGDIIQSCMKTAYMTAHNDEKGWRDWVHLYEAKFIEMIEAGLNCKVIWPERILDKDYQQLYETIEWTGLKWNNSIIPTIDKLLHRKE